MLSAGRIGSARIGSTQSCDSQPVRGASARMSSKPRARRSTRGRRGAISVHRAGAGLPQSAVAGADRAVLTGGSDRTIRLSKRTDRRCGCFRAELRPAI